MDPVLQVKIGNTKYKLEILYPKDKVYLTVYINEYQNTFIFDVMQIYFAIELYHELRKLKSKAIGDILTGKKNPELWGSYLADYLIFILDYYPEDDVYHFNLNMDFVAVQNGIAYKLMKQ